MRSREHLVVGHPAVKDKGWPSQSMEKKSGWVLEACRQGLAEQTLKTRLKRIPQLPNLFTTWKLHHTQGSKEARTRGLQTPHFPAWHIDQFSKVPILFLWKGVIACLGFTDSCLFGALWSMLGTTHSLGMRFSQLGEGDMATHSCSGHWIHSFERNDYISWGSCNLFNRLRSKIPQSVTLQFVSQINLPIL